MLPGYSIFKMFDYDGTAAARCLRCGAGSAANEAVGVALRASCGIADELLLVAWHSGRTSVFGRRTIPVLHSTCI